MATAVGCPWQDSAGRIADWSYPGDMLHPTAQSSLVCCMQHPPHRCWSRCRNSLIRCRPAHRPCPLHLLCHHCRHHPHILLPGDLQPKHKITGLAKLFLHPSSPQSPLFSLSPPLPPSGRFFFGDKDIHRPIFNWIDSCITGRNWATILLSGSYCRTVRIKG